MHIAILLAADYATVDASGKMNILGAFDTIYGFKFPTRHHMMHLVVLLKPELGEYGDNRSLRVMLVDEDGQELVRLSTEIEIPVPPSGAQPSVGAVMEFRDIVFREPGRYEFRVFLDKDQKGVLPLNVVLLQTKDQG